MERPYLRRFTRTYVFALLWMAAAFAVASLIWPLQPWTWLVVPIMPAEIGLMDCYEMQKARRKAERFERKRREMGL